MKKRVGGILIAAGALLLLNPQFNLEGLVYLLQKYLVNYWPLVLIGMGLLLQNDKKKPKRTNH